MPGRAVGHHGRYHNNLPEYEVLVIYLNFFHFVMPAKVLVKIGDQWGVTNLWWDSSTRKRRREAADTLKAWDRNNPNATTTVYRVLCVDTHADDPEYEDGDLRQVPRTGFQTESTVNVDFVVGTLASMDALDELELTPSEGGFWSMSASLPASQQEGNVRRDGQSVNQQGDVRRDGQSANLAELDVHAEADE